MEIIKVGETENSITSREFVELVNIERLQEGKKGNYLHKTLLSKIQEVESTLILRQENTQQYFLPSSYKDLSGKSNLQFILTKDGAEILAMEFSRNVRLNIFNKFKELTKPKTYEEIMQNALLLADSKVKELEKKILEDSPLVSFANTVADTSDSILIREYAKIINEEGIDMGQNKLYKWFRENGYLMKNNEPYQHFMKYFNVTETVIKTIKGDRITKTTRINGLGQLYFLEKLKNV